MPDCSVKQNRVVSVIIDLNITAIYSFAIYAVSFSALKLVKFDTRW